MYKRISTLSIAVILIVSVLLPLSCRKNAPDITSEVDVPELGITVLNLDITIVEWYELITENGVLVTQVQKDSQAELAGIEYKDVITIMAGREITSIEDMNQVIGEYAGGDEIEVIVLRGNINRVFFVTLAETSS